MLLMIWIFISLCSLYHHTYVSPITVMVFPVKVVTFDWSVVSLILKPLTSWAHMVWVLRLTHASAPLHVSLLIPNIRGGYYYYITPWWFQWTNMHVSLLVSITHCLNFIVCVPLFFYIHELWIKATVVWIPLYYIYPLSHSHLCGRSMSPMSLDVSCLVVPFVVCVRCLLWMSYAQGLCLAPPNPIKLLSYPTRFAILTGCWSLSLFWFIAYAASLPMYTLPCVP